MHGFVNVKLKKLILVNYCLRIQLHQIVKANRGLFMWMACK